MRLPYQRTIERLSMLHGKKAERGVRSPRRRLPGRRRHERRCRVRDLGPAAVPLFDVSVFQRGSWIGQVDTAVGAVPAAGCARWFELSITSTGTVAHCCMDGQADWPDRRRAETARARHLQCAGVPRALRERTASRRDVSPCRQCTFL